ncbi:lysyl oxidase family protein [Streptomyces tsukubensis]|uniref:lysyl oxidase family protein n=1 Tax=Streptomyces tsukubensis TaxID=83656 RepID=UPI00344FE59E
MSTTSRKRLWAGGLSVAAAVALAAGLVAAVPGAERSPGAATAPVISLVAASPEVTLQQWEDTDHRRYVDLGGLGTYVGVEGGPLELRATRPLGAEQVRVQQYVHDGLRVIRKDLPAGLVTDLGGLPGFTEITFTGADGETVATSRETFCPNNASARIDPGAVPTPRYPEQCHDGPFTLGMVWGVEKGWATNTSGGLTSVPLPLATGRYTARISVAEKYRELFGIADEPQTVKVNVTPPDPAPDPAVDPAPGRASAHSDHSAHSGGGGRGDLSGAARPRTAEDSSYPPAVPEVPHALKHPARAALKLLGDGPGYTDGSRFAPRAKAAAARPAGPPVVPAHVPRPDLRALPVWDIAVETERTGEPKGRDHLAFASTTWNSGDSPLVVDGFRQSGKPLMDAYQYFYDARGRQAGHAPTGTMEWDPRVGHNHWHFTDFAAYRLLTEDRKEALRSDKEAFCLVNTDAVDYTLKSADWRPHGTDLSSACGQGEPQALSIRQSLAVGSGDTYSRDLPGQSFDITDVPNGTYWIQVVANPSGRLHEKSFANNNAYRKIVLGGRPGARTVTAAPLGADQPG